MADTDAAQVPGRAPTLEWLRRLKQDHHYLAHDIARVLVNGSRFYSFEAYESTLALAKERFPWMHITRLAPNPWVPVGLGGESRPDITMLAYHCSGESAVAAGLLSEAMLPQGRKRRTWVKSEADIGSFEVRKLNGLEGESGRDIGIDCIDIQDDLPDTHPLAIFRPSVIRRAGPVSQPRGTALSIAMGRGLRLVVDNTREVRS